MILCASLREKRPNPNTEKTDQKKLRIWTLFTKCISLAALRLYQNEEYNSIA